jgi:hypothetical protein
MKAAAMLACDIWFGVTDLAAIFYLPFPVKRE